MDKQNNLKYIGKIVYLLLFALSVGCARQETSGTPLNRFIDAEAEDMEYNIRFDYDESCAVHSQKCFTGWMPSYLDPQAAETEDAGRALAQNNQAGYDTIRSLQTALSDAVIKESAETATEEGQLCYMVRNHDDFTGYFYRSGQIKILIGEDRYVYDVESESYAEILKEIDAYVPYGYYYMDQSIYQDLDTEHYDLISQISLRTLRQDTQDGMSGIILFNNPAGDPLSKEAVKILCQVISEQGQELFYIDMRNTCVDVTCSLDLMDGTEAAEAFKEDLNRVLAPILPQGMEQMQSSLPLIAVVQNGQVIDGYAFSRSDDTDHLSEEAAGELRDIYERLIALNQ
ncbi:MAG: hypothetical protein IJ225_08995 [Solobacterium sp.]|nr:hypothetical protein [Solobacterium sp.]